MLYPAGNASLALGILLPDDSKPPNGSTLSTGDLVSVTGRLLGGQIYVDSWDAIEPQATKGSGPLRARLRRMTLLWLNVRACGSGISARVCVCVLMHNNKDVCCRQAVVLHSCCCSVCCTYTYCYLTPSSFVSRCLHGDCVVWNAIDSISSCRPRVG